MKKNLSTLLLALFLGSFSLFSQNYDFNNYKYRFQKVRGFSLGSNNFNSNIENENVTNENKVDTGILDKNTENRTNFRISLGLNAYYFQNINTDNLQQNINAYVGYSNTIQPEFIKNNNNNNSGSKTFNNNNNLNTNINFSILNRYYKPSNNFTYLNLNTQNYLYSYQYNYNSESSVNSNIFSKNESQTNRMSLNSFSSIEYGFGKGRLEFVTDPIMTTFLIKDLIEKADIKNVSNEQIENIAKGMTKIRNTRFLDFRFRLIDQIEMLDEVLKQNGVTTEKVSKYYTTLNDNWLYATRFQRLSGSQWTYYIKSENNFNIRKQKNQNTYYYGSDSINSSYRKEYDHTLKNGIEIDYTKSKQKSLTVQKSKGFNVFLFNQLYKENYNVEYKGSNSATIIYDDSIQKKSYNILCQFNWNYFYQPNTRTYFDFGINPGFQLQQITLDERDKFSLSEDNFKSEAFLNLNLRYFRFISPRLSFSVNANTYSNLSINNYKIKNDGNFGLDSKVFVNTIRNNMNFGASVSYFIF